MLNNSMLEKNKFTVVTVILLIGAISWIIYQNRTIPKTGYILIQDVYNEFELKKEMEKKYLQAKNARDKILDSLAFEVKIIANKIQAEQEKNKATIDHFNLKRDEYFQRKQSYDEDNAALTKQYDQEILTQLNQYIKDYAEANHYTYVFGNDGNGSLLYGIETLNITKEVSAFVNNKYKGL
jgi:outer membrane protein